jgi:hypothetical protein
VRRENIGREGDGPVAVLRWREEGTLRVGGCGGGVRRGEARGKQEGRGRCKESA